MYIHAAAHHSDFLIFADFLALTHGFLFVLPFFLSSPAAWHRAHASHLLLRKHLMNARVILTSDKVKNFLKRKHLLKHIPGFQGPHLQLPPAVS
jgi:hypothetical protein